MAGARKLNLNADALSLQPWEERVLKSRDDELWVMGLPALTLSLRVIGLDLGRILNVST